MACVVSDSPRYHYAVAAADPFVPDSPPSHYAQKAEPSRFESASPPSHYVLKVESFSQLTKSSLEKYESGEFEAGGYKWRLVLYPNGNKNRNVKEHISLYLGLEGASSHGPGWEIYVIFRFFLLDQNNGEYIIVQDALGKERRFHKMKLEWGFDEFISLKSFKDESNGYLVDDTCVFGAEVFVCKERTKGKGECLTMMKDASTYKHFWEIKNFSKLAAECYDSQSFTAGNYQWKIQVYPKGKGTGLGSYVSLFLALVDPATLSPACKIYTEVTLRILDQKQSKPYYGKAKFWFKASSQERGWTKFILLSSFTNQFLGYLVNDSCLVEAEVEILGVVDALS